MKNYTLFNYNFLFCDHFAKLSDQAKLLYIKLNFFADKGFVANPIQIADSLKYSNEILTELIDNEDILKLPNRDEIFITAYYLHNKTINMKEWLYSPFAIYWKGKLWIKENGMATFKKQNFDITNEKKKDDELF